VEPGDADDLLDEVGLALDVGRQDGAALSPGPRRRRRGSPASRGLLHLGARDVEPGDADDLLDEVGLALDVGRQDGAALSPGPRR
ncbi:hypothetical protein CTI14_66900, partial [Methylobacterium radiotolerans]